MNIATAGKIKEGVLKCTRQLDDSVQAVQSQWQSPRAEMYRRLVGQVMGKLFADVLVQLYRSHPELEPDELRSARSSDTTAVPLPAALASALVFLMEEISRHLDSLVEDARTQESAADCEQLENSLRGSLEGLNALKIFVQRAAAGRT